MHRACRQWYAPFLRQQTAARASSLLRGVFHTRQNAALQGAPLAYTPFCDNNRDMDGFRFWKQGFWKEHLRGRPYHISALYVVDLARFRCGTSLHAWPASGLAGALFSTLHDCRPLGGASLCPALTQPGAGGRRGCTSVWPHVTLS